MKFVLIGGCVLIAMGAAFYLAAGTGISESEIRYFDNKFEASDSAERSSATNLDDKAAASKAVIAFLNDKSREISVGNLEGFRKQLYAYHEGMTRIKPPAYFAAYHAVKLQLIKEKTSIISDAVPLAQNGALNDEFSGVKELKAKFRDVRQRDDKAERDIEIKFREYLKVVEKRESDKNSSTNK